MLSREEVELYRRDGYLPGRLLSAAEAERLRDDCLRTCAEPLRARRSEPVQSEAPCLEPGEAVPVVSLGGRAVRHASILDLVEAVIGPDILVFHTTVWLKPPRSETTSPGTRTRPISDWHRSSTSPPGWH